MAYSIYALNEGNDFRIRFTYAEMDLYHEEGWETVSI